MVTANESGGTRPSLSLDLSFSVTQSHSWWGCQRIRVRNA